MDKKVQMLLENQLAETDGFSFKCNKCGKCCIGNDGIILTPYDLFYMARELKVTIEEILQNYCKRYIGQSSKLPVVIIGEGRCPFLTDSGCRLKESKPVICKMYPLGRGFDGTKLVYFDTKASCGEPEFNQSVRGWLDYNGVGDENKEFTEKWYELLKKLTTYIYNANFSDRELDAFQRSMAVLLYLCYDVDGYFYSQFLDRVEVIERITEEIKKD